MKTPADRNAQHHADRIRTQVTSRAIEIIFAKRESLSPFTAAERHVLELAERVSPFIARQLESLPGWRE